MKIIVFIGAVFFSIHSLFLSSTINPLRTHKSIVDNFAHYTDIVIKPGQKEEIIKTFESFHTASLKNLIPAIEIIIKHLTFCEKKYINKESLSLSNQISLTVISSYKDHLIQYLTFLYTRLPWWEKPLLFFYKHTVSGITKCVNLFRPYQSDIQKLVAQLEWYLTFEKEYLLNTYDNALHFFAYIKKTPYPPLFSLWKNDQSQLTLLTLLYQLNTTITTQGEVLELLGGNVAKEAATDIIGSTFEIGAEEAAATAVEETGKEITTEIAETLGEDVGVGGAEELGELSDEELDALTQMVSENMPEEDIEAFGENEQAITDVKEQLDDFLDTEIEPSDFIVSENVADQGASDIVTDTADESSISFLGSIKDRLLNATMSLAKSFTRKGNILKNNPLLRSERTLKLTNKARLEEILTNRAAKMRTLKATFTDTNKGFFKRATAYLKYGYTKIKAPLNYIGDRWDAYVSSKFNNYVTRKFGKTLDALEDNNIRAALKALPPSWQTIADLLIQMEIMQATSLVAFWYEQDFEETFAQWQEKQYEMSQLNSKFLALMTVQQKQNLNLANKKFILNVTNVTNAQQAEQTICTFAQTWIEQAVFSSPPASFFTAAANTIGNNNIPAMDDDIKFRLSTMITPEALESITENPPKSSQAVIFNPHTPNAWRNVYRQGNWQFMPLNNTFSQLQVVPIEVTDPITTANKILGNSIFREYIPTQQLNYSLSVECTLYNYEFPFFIGLLFNKGRWISGIPDREQQTRFAGLYGTVDKKIYFVCEESKNSSAAEIKGGAPSTQSPFYRILQNPTAYTLTQNLVTVEKLPFKYTIQTTTHDIAHPTQAATLNASFTPAKSSKPTLSITIPTCSVSNGLQHGIGFVSAGCRGSFTIKEPISLTYSDKDLTLFKQNTSILMNKNSRGSS